MRDQERDDEDAALVALDLTTGAVGLPVNLRDKATPVDETMAGTSRTQVYASGEDLLFTLYQPVSTDGGAWEYGFVHTLATAWAACGASSSPTSWAWRTTAAPWLSAPITGCCTWPRARAASGPSARRTYRPSRWYRTASLGVAADAQPVMAAGSDRLWVGLGRRLLVVDPISLEVVAHAELPAAVTP